MVKWGSCDFKELEALQKRMQEAVKIQDDFMESCVKELAARLLAKVIKRTPVGKKPKIAGPKTMKVTSANGKTKSFLTREGSMIEKYWSGYVGGTLRRGWTGGKNTDATVYANSLKVSRAGGRYVIEIINPVHYASYVEYGHRQMPGRYVPQIGKSLKVGWTPGKFMLTISEKELRRMTPAILEKKLQKFMEDTINGK